MHEAELTMPKGAFGRLLKFWRKTRGLSQETLAHKVGSSLRHISFLETGKSLPGQELVEKLAELLELNVRETNNLLASAGYAPTSFTLKPDSHEHHWLRQSLIATLRGFDPFPAMIIDQYGSARMINRGMLTLIKRFTPITAAKDSFNMVDLIFTEQGFKPFLIGWEDTICALLMTLQQDILMYQDPWASQLLQRVLQEKSVPKDWRKRGSKQMNVTGFVTTTEFPGRGVEQWMHVFHTVGATSFVSEPKLMIHAIFPKEHCCDPKWEELVSRCDADHPLLPY
ncbi:helix-turn-helix domain-containing protein [Ferrimonas sp.]|uniref:helix-turn-helix domain-containing protein n=1 Tax=Ferrimonas sp. TaxID=2080861 RepID=UPI003A94FCC8